MVLRRSLLLPTFLIVVCSISVAVLGSLFNYQNVYSNTISDSAAVSKATDRQYYHCSNYEYTNGSWSLAVMGENESYITASNISKNMTTVTNAYGFPKYIWKVKNPSECRLEDWDPDLFCDTLNGRSILIVGDSINNLLFHTIFDTTKGTKGPCTVTWEETGGRPPVCMQRHGTICNATSRVSFVRNDQLSLTLNRSQSALEPWIPMLHDYQVLILNRGAHAKPTVVHRKILEDVKYALRDQNYNGSVFFRTTPRGHIGCSNDAAPMESEFDVNWKRYFPENNESQIYQKYRYGWFPEQNALYKEIFEPYQVLDVQRITELRPDGHKGPPIDCLHYLNLEVFESWLWLLMNGLRYNLQ